MPRIEAIPLTIMRAYNFDPMTKGTYTEPGRLGDVLALIQVLAFDPDTHRSESGIIEKELGPPASRLTDGLRLPRNILKSSEFPRRRNIRCRLLPVTYNLVIQQRNARRCQRSSRKRSSTQRLSCMTARWMLLHDGGISYPSGLR
jgi:hypothetical protein